MIIRNATFHDNEQLIELTSLTPMAGVISLRIDRKPDFFSLLKKRGEYKVIVAEKSHRIIGSISCTIQPTIICNKEYPVYYLGDLKVHPDFTGTHLAYRIVKAMLEELQQMGADILFCTAADGNKAVQPIFEGT